MKVVISGIVSGAVFCFFYGTRLVALFRMDGGVQPIAVGYILRRMCAKILSTRIHMWKRKRLDYWLGYGTRSGTESVGPAAGEYISYHVIQPTGDRKMVVRLDSTNFHMLHRQKYLTSVVEEILETHSFLWQCYQNSSPLLFGTYYLSPLRGVHQGDPLDPPVFSLQLCLWLNRCNQR